jgi:pyruvate dehydrogenase E2 component (dihydrolipoamide acetyltransferase)
MAREVRLPQLGQTMEEGTIVGCLVKVGDEVKKGDVIFEIETDKATLEMESPADGFVKHILAELEQTLPVGAPLMVMGDKEEEVPQSFIDSLKGDVSSDVAGENAAMTVTQATQQAPVAKPAKAEPSKPTGKILASPRAKKIAKEFSVDLATVIGTGPGGKITEQNVKDAAAPKKTVAPEMAGVAIEPKLGQSIPMNRLQKLIAERMLKSKHEIPCFYLTVKADVTDLVELRAKLNKNSDVKISYNDFIIKSVATALVKYSLMTGQAEDETIKLPESINVGLAISVPDGLVAPIIKDVNKKDVKQIARDRKAIVEKAWSDKLALTDLEGGCITVSNLGASEVDSFIPIVVPGQCSILGIGRITDTCVPDSGNILVRKLMNMTLSVDHKVANGAYAAKFLDFVRKQLEDTSTFSIGNS